MKTASRVDDIRPFYVMDLLSRAKQLEQSGKSIVHMEVGEPDFTTPQPIIDAATSALADGQIKYTPAAGLADLRQRIARYYADSYDVNIDSHRLFITPGASGALMLALAMLIDPGAEVLLPDPCYPCNRNFIRLFDGRPVLIPVDGLMSYQLGADLIDRYWNSNTSGTIVASPSNPTGTMLSAWQLQSVIDAVKSHDGWVISDEIYHGLVYEEQMHSALEFDNTNTLVINSFSKYFGMTGWRLGWLVVPEALIESAEKLMQNLFIASSSIAQVAALSAFDSDTVSIMEERRMAFQTRRDFLNNALQSLGFSISCKPEGAFYIYADCHQLAESSDQLASDLLEHAGVAVTPGRDFGDYRYNQHIRFAYTTSLDNLKLGVERIAKYLQKA